MEVEHALPGCRPGRVLRFTRLRPPAAAAHCGWPPATWAACSSSPSHRPRHGGGEPPAHAHRRRSDVEKRQRVFVLPADSAFDRPDLTEDHSLTGAPVMTTRRPPAPIGTGLRQAGPSASLGRDRRWRRRCAWSLGHCRPPRGRPPQAPRGPSRNSSGPFLVQQGQQPSQVASSNRSTRRLAPSLSNTARWRLRRRVPDSLGIGGGELDLPGRLPSCRSARVSWARRRSLRADPVELVGGFAFLAGELVDPRIADDLEPSDVSSRRGWRRSGPGRSPGLQRSRTTVADGVPGW